MGRTFYITLSDAKGVYWAGDILSGNVVLETDDDVKMNGLFLQLTGTGTVHWIERIRSDQRRVKKIHYKSVENYFDEKVTLISSPNDESTTLGPGVYKYPFEYKLLDSLPCSYEGRHGKIRYNVKATFDIPWAFDLVTNKIFTILSRYDLNTIPDASLGQNGRDEKSLCCLCCTSGPIIASISIPRTGYTPGESIPITANTVNHSNREMDVSFSLEQAIIYRATQKTRRVNSVVKIMTKKGLPANSQETFTDVPFKVPSLPPSSLAGCNIIDIRYKLKMKVDPYGPAIDICLPLDIIIGNVALNNVQLFYDEDNNSFVTSNDAAKKQLAKEKDSDEDEDGDQDGGWQPDYGMAGNTALNTSNNNGDMAAPSNKSLVSLKVQDQPDNTSLPGQAEYQNDKQ